MRTRECDRPNIYRDNFVTKAVDFEIIVSMITKLKLLDYIFNVMP